jgi:hypothetical protein
MEFNWIRAHSQSSNGIVHLRPSGTPPSPDYRVASANFAFSIQGVELEDFKLAPGSGVNDWKMAWKNCKIDIEATQAAVKDYVIKHLTRPFKFTRKLYGKQAFDFFGQRDPVTYLIQAHRLGDTAIFSARRFPPIAGRTKAE